MKFRNLCALPVDGTSVPLNENPGKKTIIHKGAPSTRNFVILHALSARPHPLVYFDFATRLDDSYSPFDENKLNFRPAVTFAKIDFHVRIVAKRFYNSTILCTLLRSVELRWNRTRINYRR